MASPRSLLSFSTLIMHILAKPLQALSAPSSALSQILPMVNSTTLPTLNASTPENPALNIQCNGEHFGYHPSIADCQSALEHLAPDSTQYKWGQRHSGLGQTVCPLPYRIMGGQFGQNRLSYPVMQLLVAKWWVKYQKFLFLETYRSRFVFLSSCASSKRSNRVCKPWPDPKRRLKFDPAVRGR